MGVTSGSKGKKDLNVELNLLPVFDVLSVCICFLLMTVVWTEVKTLETKQTYGSEQAVPDLNSRSVFLEISAQNNVTVSYRQGEKVLRSQKYQSVAGQIDLKGIQKSFKDLKSLNVTSGQLMPSAGTSYQDVMSLFDLLKSNGLNNLGLSPI